MADAGSKAHMLVAGASGVIGSAAVGHFARKADWCVTALSRRRPAIAEDAAFTHVSADLQDTHGCAQLVEKLPPVTHLVYAAVSEAPGLVTGWRDASLIQANGRMYRNLLEPIAATGTLRHVSILQGGKAYGAHMHPVTVPLRESQPRDDHANFYWLHEDATRELAARHGFAFTIWRPQILLGTAPGAAMNPVAAIGAFAALCHERGLPFSLPGQSGALWEMVDADLMAQAFDWAADNSAAAGETYNITNGDIFVLRHAWPQLAGALGLDQTGDAPPNLVRFFAENANQQAWARMAEREKLKIGSLNHLLGESHHYFDLLTGSRIAQKPAPALVSTIRIRQAGFAECCDSLHSLLRQIAAMVDLGLLPPSCLPMPLR